MRRLLAIAILAALPVAAQMHHGPALGPAFTPGHGTLGPNAGFNALGPGAGYSALGPAGSVHPRFHRQPGNPMFRNPGYGHGRADHRGFRRHARGRYARGYYPVYAYPYYYDYPAAYAEPAYGNEEPAEEEPSASAPDDQRYGEHYTDYREDERRHRSEEEARQAEEDRRRGEEARQAEAAQAQPKPRGEEPATVLVFKDGHHQDVSSYAITGDVLYDLGNGRARKILLADLDLPATSKLNDELGNDFRLPSRPAK